MRGTELWVLRTTSIIHLSSALCRGELEATKHSVLMKQHRRRCVTEDFSAFLTLWLGLFANMTALAVCSRSLSATMDYISGSRYQQWIQAKIGSLPSILGRHLPDFMALVVTAVPSVLFMLGLEVCKLYEPISGALGTLKKCLQYP
jgi:hypothetical protein